MVVLESEFSVQLWAEASVWTKLNNMRVITMLQFSPVPAKQLVWLQLASPFPTSALPKG